MKQIFKYTLRPEEYVKIPSTDILSVIAQGRDIIVYAIVDSENQTEYEYDFQVIGTGHMITTNLNEYKFLSTVELGVLVFHVFYKRV